MKTIDIEDAVFQALEKLVKGFDEKPNDVIKRLLFTAASAPRAVEPAIGLKAGSKKDPLVEFVESPEYLCCDAKARYFGVLRFLFKNHPQEFVKLDGYKRGKRIQISKDAMTIERSGHSTIPQKLDGTPYWVLSNLSNLRKRAILEDALRYFHYPNEIIDPVLKSIPDSGISRSKRLQHYDVD
jgi:negative regulator of replication initiation